MAPEAGKNEACYNNNKNKDKNNNPSVSLWDNTFVFIKDFYLFVWLEAKASAVILVSVQLVLSANKLLSCFLLLPCFYL